MRSTYSNGCARAIILYSGNTATAMWCPKPNTRLSIVPGSLNNFSVVLIFPIGLHTPALMPQTRKASPATETGHQIHSPVLHETNEAMQVFYKWSTKQILQPPTTMAVSNTMMHFKLKKKTLVMPKRAK